MSSVQGSDSSQNAQSPYFHQDADGNVKFDKAVKVERDYYGNIKFVDAETGKALDPATSAELKKDLQQNNDTFANGSSTTFGANTTLGKNDYFNRGDTFGANTTFGNNVNLGSNVHLGADTKVDNDVNVASNFSAGAGSEVQKYVTVNADGSLTFNLALSAAWTNPTNPDGSPNSMGTYLIYDATTGLNLSAEDMKTIQDDLAKSNIKLGDNDTFAAGTTIGKGATIGNNDSFGKNDHIGENTKIGNNNSFGNNVTVSEGRNLGDLQKYADNSTVTTDTEKKSSEKGVYLTDKYHFTKNADNTYTVNDITTGKTLDVEATKTLMDEFKKANITIGDDDTFGANSFIGADSSFGSHSKFGDNDSFGFNTKVGDNVTIGSNDSFGANNTIGSRDSFGDNDTVGNNNTFSSSVHFKNNDTIMDDCTFNSYMSVGSYDQFMSGSHFNSAIGTYQSYMTIGDRNWFDGNQDWGTHTTVGNDGKFDNLTHNIGSGQTGALRVAGWDTFGNNVWVHRGGTFRFGVTMDDDASVRLGCNFFGSGAHIKKSFAW